MDRVAPVYSEIQLFRSYNGFRDDQPWVSAPSYEETLDAEGYVNQDIKPETGWVLNFYLGLQNAANNHYASMILINAPSFDGSPPRYYYPAEPRNYFGGVSVECHFNSF